MTWHEFFLFSVSGSMYNGETSYVEVEVNTTLFTVAEIGSFHFRTRKELGRLLYIQWYNKPDATPSLSVEFQVFAGKFQAITEFSEGWL